MNTYRRAAGTRTILMVLAAAFVLSAAARAEEPARFELAWGSFGSDSGQFIHPTGITVDESGNVYVADWGNDRIQKFDPNGAVLGVWGARGAGPLEFNGPYDVTVGNGIAYVSDFGNRRVQAIRADDGRFLYETVSFHPSGVTYMTGGVQQLGTVRFWVLDFGGRHAYSTYTLDIEGPHLMGITMGTGGGFYVADFGGDKISRFDYHVFNGPAASWTLLRPMGLDRRGDYLYVTAEDTLIKQTLSGTTVWTTGGAGNGDGEFSGAVDVAVAPSGAIYVLDQGNERVQKFVP